MRGKALVVHCWSVAHQQIPAPIQCSDPLHGKDDVCLTCGKRFRCSDPEHGRHEQCQTREARFGKTWCMKYYIAGKAVRESTGTEKKTEAERILKDREGKAATRQPILPRTDRIRYEEAAQDLRQHYRVTRTRNLDEAEARLMHLDAFFGPYRLARIGPADATAYAQRRQGQGASNGTINRELPNPESHVAPRLRERKASPAPDHPTA